MSYVLLIVGFVLLVKGADFFVEGSSSLARRFGIPSLIIGLTIVAFGTSAPEAAVSITAGLTGKNEMALANVIGSNFFNLAMVLGICALIKPVMVDRDVMRQEYPLSLIAVFALLFLSLDTVLGGQNSNILARSDGLVLLLFFFIFLYSTIRSALSHKKESKDAAPPAPSEKEDQAPAKPPRKLWMDLLLTAGGLVGIILGGDFVVDSASNIAAQFGVSENLIGLTIVAIGTSLPELVTSIVASTKGENDIAVGNVVGSNLFNVLFVLAASASLSPIVVTGEAIMDIILMLGVSLLTFWFAWSKRSINRLEGGALVLSYAAYTTYILIR